MGRENQVSKLLEFMMRGGSETIDKLQDSLRASGPGRVVDAYLCAPRKPDTGASDGECVGWQVNESNHSLTEHSHC